MNRKKLDLKCDVIAFYPFLSMWCNCILSFLVVGDVVLCKITSDKTMSHLCSCGWEIQNCIWLQKKDNLDLRKDNLDVFIFFILLFVYSFILYLSCIGKTQLFTLVNYIASLNSPWIEMKVNHWVWGQVVGIWSSRKLKQ